MIDFEDYPQCENCSLYESARHPGIPTRPLYDGQEVTKERALLFVGQSPGFNEDKEGKSFVGYTGQLLTRFCDGSRLSDYVDIYLSNACRCKPPQGADESQSQRRACRPFLQEDLDKLYAYYKEVIIVNLGAKACYSTMNISSLNEALKKQATHTKVFTQEPRVFSTYHPAMLHSSRKPGLVRAVETHFSLILRLLKGEFIPNELKIDPELGIAPPDVLPAEVSLDIETYGILAGVEQIVFHPVKSKEVDGVDYKYQIVTVSFAWEEEGKIRTGIYIYQWKKHRQKIREWFRKIAEQKVTCLGQNLKFDLLYLYMSQDPEIPYWIDPRRLKLDDTLILSFLLFEQQPEKGLKELSTLFGITDYSGLRVTGKSGTAKSNRDKDLHYYNCLDSAATLVLAKELRRRIKDKYGETTSKLSSTSARVRNMILWDCFDLEVNGSCFDIKKIKEYHNREETRCNRLMKLAEGKYGIKFAGKGSDAPLRQLMLDCLDEANLMSDDRVEWTKTGQVSIGVENVNLVKSVIIGGRNAAVISSYQQYKERSKIVSTYTGPILGDKRRGIVKVCGNVGRVFPNWYPIPAYSERGGGSDEKIGGQIQGRFSCKKPARQTEPPRIRKCGCSRWPNGKLIEYDINQDHLRMAALLSGDPPLVDTYTKEGMESVHAQTALSIFPNENPIGFKKREPVKYKVGKELNFLVLFRGGATTYRDIVMKKVGVELEIPFCIEAIKTWYGKHPVYREWQDKMLELAEVQGYLMLPTGWSRTFGKGKKAIESQTGEVLNFLHQAPCAQITQSAHYQIKLEFMKQYLRSVICLNIHDALFVDTYPGEESIVDEIVDKAMTHPPLLPVFEDWCGRTIPWAYEKKG